MASMTMWLHLYWCFDLRFDLLKCIPHFLQAYTAPSPAATSIGGTSINYKFNYYYYFCLAALNFAAIHESILGCIREFFECIWVHLGASVSRIWVLHMFLIWRLRSLYKNNYSIFCWKFFLVPAFWKQTGTAQWLKHQNQPTMLIFWKPTTWYSIIHSVDQQNCIASGVLKSFNIWRRDGCDTLAVTAVVFSDRALFYTFRFILEDIGSLLFL